MLLCQTNMKDEGKKTKVRVEIQTNGTCFFLRVVWITTSVFHSWECIQQKQ